MNIRSQVAVRALGHNSRAAEAAAAAGNDGVRVKMKLNVKLIATRHATSEQIPRAVTGVCSLSLMINCVNYLL